MAKKRLGSPEIREKSIRIHHLNPADFPGISFQYQILQKGECSGKICVPARTVIDHRGKLRLDQNDGTKLPNANLNMGHNNGIDADKLDGFHLQEILTDHLFVSEIDTIYTTTSNQYTKCCGFIFTKKNLWQKIYAQFELYSSSAQTAYARLKITDGSTTLYSNETSTTTPDTWEKKNLAVDLTPFTSGTTLEIQLQFRKDTPGQDARCRKIEIYLAP